MNRPDRTAPLVKPAATADLRNGNNVYQGKCGACHGGRAEGIAAMSTPRLSSLDAAYMTRQFRNFQHGLRGSSPPDKVGRQMAMMSTTLPRDADLPDVIAFINALGAPLASQPAAPQIPPVRAPGAITLSTRSPTRTRTA